MSSRHTPLAAAALCATLMVTLGGAAGSAQRAQGPRAGQPQAPPDSARSLPAPDSARGVRPANAHETREELMRLLTENYPPSVAQVLRLDPSLLSQSAYLETYPELAAFLAQHPEVVRDPAFYIGRAQSDGVYDNRARALNAVSSFVTGSLVLLGFASFLTAFAWVIRSTIDYRRWLRLSKIQVEVHGKLMDRLSSNEDLLAYMQSSAGRRFLEAAPIPVDSGSRSLAAPLSRIFWSAQVGIVLAVGGLGLQYVSRRVVYEEIAQGLYIMGVIGSALGLGFVLSAVVAYVLSRRLGLVEPVTGSMKPEAEEPSPPA